MTGTAGGPQRVGRFLKERPGDLRVAHPWHRYAHHIRTLPSRLEALARGLPVGAGNDVLDYGCADVPYRRFFPAEVRYEAADLPGNPQATLTLRDDATVPVADQSFDALLSTQVLEHVADPELYLAECFRVLRPGGRMLLSTHGVFVYHPDPVDLWRWTCDGLQRAVRQAGFQIEVFEGIIGPLSTGLQLVQDAVYWHLPWPLRPLYALVLQTLIRVTDGLESQASKDLNGQVFALVAVKP